ncbi:MAG TPA: hypothetical protein DDX39_01445 [Bacteroidales bacterium]|nr:MAG: hypothetical protein A2W98_07660 [Bacteroidetes bacterium GWF2_33_38]OFY76540.1 MAG: hypothetical protein A2265_10965 [Bacteroidetes bacterium RIFOXYA12_FULL_33_9]OFY88113.1 MAG: hypothetical protein A2236_13045 [Bacteroidetes bacterium RIFOXYA2_FULL_33_7]HBF87276.1 hypothetical protein [Bacteroidales bacterium]
MIKVSKNISFIDIHSHKSFNNENEFRIQNIMSYDFDNLNIIASKYYSIGIHPWFINSKNTERELEKLKMVFAKYKNFIALGEAGIDRVKSINLDEQKYVFTQQTMIAESLNKPVIVHCVRAYMDVLEIRKTIHAKVPWIFHEFSENIQVANQLIHNSCYASIGSRILNENDKLNEVVKNIDINYIFVETDEFEGCISEIYEKIAKIRGIKVSQLQRQVLKNFKNIFK